MALKDGATLLVASGGDGTFNEVMNAVAGTGVPMCLLPMGTTNVLAKELGIPENVPGAVQRILNGRAHELFTGRLTFGSGQVRKFFLMAGIGFDADAVYRVNKKMKKYSGKAAYISSGLRNLLKWKPEPVTVLVDGRQYSASSLIVCNGAKYGGEIKAAPEAGLHEPFLYALVMTGFKRRDVMRYALGIILGRQMKTKGLVYLKCNLVEVLADRHLQADGDYIGHTPVIIDIAPETVKLIY